MGQAGTSRSSQTLHSRCSTRTLAMRKGAPREAGSQQVESVLCPSRHFLFLLVGFGIFLLS